MSWGVPLSKFIDSRVMTYTIKDGCTACDSCRPACPRQAIQLNPDAEGYWIDPTLCDGCPDLEIPACVTACDLDQLHFLPAKKGRSKSTLLPAAIPDIFLNGKTNPFASSLVMWETCNLLTQRQGLPWQTDSEGRLCYRRPVQRGLGELRFRLAPDPTAVEVMPPSESLAALGEFELRAACVHLIFSAYAVTQETPWKTSFTLTSQHFEQYLGLEKRKDLTKLEKLTLIKDLVYQTCRFRVAINWPRQGRVQGFSLAEHAVWQLMDTQYYFEQDREGHDHLIGLSFVVQAGDWAQKFLNKQRYRQQTAFYQYSTLPRSLLLESMSSWQQHEGAVRLLLWLLFKLRLGGDQRMTVRKLLRIAYGDARVVEATTVRGAHKRLLKTFENDLEALYSYGLIPLFDPDTYPVEIQPFWARVAEIPEDAEAALDFWTEDAQQSQSLTTSAPRDKWQRLLNARILSFELPEDWQQTLRQPSKRRRKRAAANQRGATLSGDDIKAARQQQSLSQRALAQRLGKSQSWIRDVEKGRFKVNLNDQALLQQVLAVTLG